MEVGRVGDRVARQVRWVERNGRRRELQEAPRGPDLGGDLQVVADGDREPKTHPCGGTDMGPVATGAELTRIGAGADSHWTNRVTGGSEDLEACVGSDVHGAELE